MDLVSLHRMRRDLERVKRTFHTRHRWPRRRHGDVAATCAVAKQLFEERWRGRCCLASMGPASMTEAVLAQLAVAAEAEAALVLTNRCCARSDCPTTVFYQAVLDALDRPDSAPASHG